MSDIPDEAVRKALSAYGRALPDYRNEGAHRGAMAAALAAAMPHLLAGYGYSTCIECDGLIGAEHLQRVTRPMLEDRIKKLEDLLIEEGMFCRSCREEHRWDGCGCGDMREAPAMPQRGANDE